MTNKEKIDSMKREYDLGIGNLGRGAYLPIEDVLSLVPVLISDGYVPFTTPGKGGLDARFIQLYGSDNYPANGVWYGFVKDIPGTTKGYVVAFESPMADVRRFHEATGKTLDAAVKEAETAKENK